MRRYFIVLLLVVLTAGAGVLLPAVRDRVRSYVRAVMRPEPPAPITPIALATLPTIAAAPTTLASPTATGIPVTATVEAEAQPTPALPFASPTPLPTSTLTPTPLPSPTAGPVEVNGRLYDAYIPAATKDAQAYQYSCEFDAVWVILQTYGFGVGVDDLIAVTDIDRSIEPYIEETAQGVIIHGGDITTAFSGDYTKNFLARSTGAAMSKVFENYGLQAIPVNNRAGVETALRAGALVWMKTTVDFKPWRPATWLMPDGRTHRTVLGNDHAVVVIGFNTDVVVIRDVLGPTSSNWQRPYEYEVDWATFLASWEAQSFDGLAVPPPVGG